MPRARWMCWLAAVWVVTSLGALAQAADFVQPARSAEFLKACQRRDRELKAYFGKLMPSAFEFSHLGRFEASVHREGLDRAVLLVPVRTMPYADADELRHAARQKRLAIGALDLPYAVTDQGLTPGYYVLLYDGWRVSLTNSRGRDAGKFIASLGTASADAPVDMVIGTVASTPSGLANITPEGDVQLYLQLAGEKGALKDAEGFVKLALTFSIPGFVIDDSTPDRELAKPKEPDETGK